MRSIYNFHNSLVFRTPLLPLQKAGISSSDFFTFSKQPSFKEAIYLASPVLYTELEKWHSGALSDEKETDKLLISLYKYYVRMQSRCTPYGLFAGCSVSGWGTANEVMLDQNLKRDTRLDMNYLCSLAQQLNKNPLIISLLSFFPNNSIYEFGGNLRYVEYNYVNNRRVHQISSIANSVYVGRVLTHAEKGASLASLAELLTDDEISREEAEAFIGELISNQVLVSELEPALTGDEFIYRIIGTLTKINAEQQDAYIISVIQLLESCQQQIAAIDTQTGNSPDAYRQIYEQLKTLGTGIEENQLFQTDLYKSSPSSTLHSGIQEELAAAMEFMNRLSTKFENPQLSKFRENFYAQYDQAEVSLLEALDTETGIGYTGKDVSGVNTLIDDLFMQTETSGNYDIRWNKGQQLLHDKLLLASKNSDYSVTFSDEDVKDFRDYSEELPDTFPIMFRMINETKICLQTLGGSSAANLLGRFAHGDSRILGIIHNITEHEQQLNPDKILAEIVHLPESRVGNILFRPILRQYEIPYLAKSGLAEESRIELKDLVVSIKKNRVVLRSKKLDKEIIPRLSTAHNYSYNALPVYQFLCDLQTQDFEKSAFGFNWGNLSYQHKFLPRAEYRNTILARAQWQFIKSELRFLLDEKGEALAASIHKWRKEWQIPSQVFFAESDNELYINFDDELSVRMFISVLRKTERIVLKEFLFDHSDMIVKDQEGHGYTNEFIAVLLKKKEKKKTPAGTGEEARTAQAPSLQRSFITGSEWLYYKFYCGIKTGDHLLAEVIKPLTEELAQHQWIDKFFFIRYADPEVHIRFRLHITKPEYTGHVITAIHRYIQPLVEKALVLKVQTDTYTRELERYGIHSMELGEAVFNIDSMATLNLLSMIDGEEGEQVRWQFALRSMDEFLGNFGYTLAEKLVVLEQLKEQYVNEHGGNKELQFQLDTKFRNLRQDVEGILNREKDSLEDFQPVLELLEWKREQLAPLAEKLIALKEKDMLSVPLNDLMKSYLHMMLNRIFRARQRTIEMVLYSLLYKYYKSAVAKEKTKQRVAIDL
jgi:thiopeptide-type bacteriocin biosynthesis protein